MKVKTRSKAADNTHLAPVGVTVTHVGVEQATLKWASRGKNLRYRVALSTSPTFTNSTYRYVNTTTATIPHLAGGRTYYARVRVVSKTINANLGAESAPVTFTTGPAPTGSGQPATVTVSSYNIGAQSVNTGGSWNSRRKTVAATIRNQKPDVIGLQEAGQGKVKPGKDLSQAEDLLGLLGAPYVLANTARYNCQNATSPHKCKPQHQGASNSQKIAYNTRTLTLLSHGSKRTSSSKTKFTEHRYVEWATFQHKTTGRQFLVVNVHLDPGTKQAAMRKTQTRQVLEAIKTNNPHQLPVYVVGDFNSHKWTTPANTPYDMMTAASYVDPLGNTWKSTTTAPGATVQQRIRTNYSSYNGWKRTGAHKPGWINGIYLDYIFTSPGVDVVEWETVVNTDTKGNLSGTIGSDHNMLRATTQLP